MKLREHIILATGVLLCAARGFASESDGVAHNPFARPAPAIEPKVTAGPFAAGEPVFRLRATMTAGADSLVNIDGKIVAIGDVVAGFRLVAVGEGTAVFARDGVRFPLTVARAEGDEG